MAFVRSFVPTIFGALSALCLIACVRPSPGSAASLVTDEPPQRRAGPPPKLAEAQPDPESPFARDARAELVLGRIGFMTGSARRRAEEARRKRDTSAFTCWEALHGKLTTLEEQARSKHAELREAVFDKGPAGETLWAELEKLEAESKRSECGGGYQFLSDDVVVSGRLAMDQSKQAYAVQQIYASRSISASLRDARRRAPLLAQVGPLPPLPAPAPPKAPQAPLAAREKPRDTALLLRSARLTLAVYEVDKRMDMAAAVASELGGYLALRSERELTVRVPRERFDQAIERLTKLGDVLHRSVVAEDVTDQYVDLELRLRNAQAVRARLEKLLEQATVRDAVEIHKELAKVTDEIERLEGKLKLLRDRVSYSTIALRFEAVEAQRVRAQALLPFPWMRTMGLKPLLEVAR